MSNLESSLNVASRGALAREDSTEGGPQAPHHIPSCSDQYFTEEDLEAYSTLALHEKLEQDWKLAFKRPVTEARYVEHTFRPAGIWFPALATAITGGVLLSLNFLYFQADVFGDSPADFFFTKPSWQREATRTVYILNFVFGFLHITVASSQILLALLGRGNEVPGHILELLWLYAGCSMLSTSYLADWRLLEWCRPNEFSILLGDEKVVSQCRQFVDPYYFLNLIVSFVLPTRLRYWIPATLLLTPVHFFYRHKVLNTTFFHLTTADGVWLSMFAIMFIVMVAVENMNRRQYKASAAVEHEAQESQRATKALDKLLVSMLPRSVLRRIVAGETIADSAVATSVFSDVAGFTAWCSMRKAKDVVSMVNTMYTLFDKGLERYGIEKIKTIGDAYWAVCGLPDPNPRHALHICAFTNFMHGCVRRMEEMKSHHKISIRVGVHTGPVCGGVVGTQQSTYDVFGSCVETAQLMEQKSPVGGVLISHATMMELRRYGLLPATPGTDSTTLHNPGVCELSLQDEALPTLEGPLATYTLKAFSWLPPRVQDGADDDDDFVSDLAVEKNFTNTQKNTSSSKPHSPNQISVPVFESTPCDGEKDRKDEVPVVEDSHEAQQDPQRTPPAQDGEQSPKSPPITLQEYKERISKASGKLLFTFDDPDVEQECTSFIWLRFPQKQRTMAFMMGLYVGLLYIVQLSTTTGNNPAVHVLMVLNLLLQAGLYGLADKLHPYLGLGLYYVGCQLLLVALVLAEDSVITIELLYVTYSYLIFSMVIGFVGGYNYLLQCLLNLTFLTLPQFVVELHFKTMYIHYLIGPCFFCTAWIVGLRRSEKDLRKLFVDQKLQDVALQQTVEEHEKVSKLLSRMVPQFIVEDLTVWFCGTRTTELAVSFPCVGILFFRIPAFAQHFSSMSPEQVMRQISNYVTVCDRVLAAFTEHCTKLKIVGDIVVIGSGLEKHPAIAAKEADAAKKRDHHRQERLRKLKEHRINTLNQNGNRNNGEAYAEDGDVTPPVFSDESTNPSMLHDSTEQLSIDTMSLKKGATAADEHQHLNSLALLATTMASTVESELQSTSITTDATSPVLCAGMHCGPVTGGIIGTDRLIYDVFGDTVNTASRVMSTSNGKGLWATRHFRDALPQHQWRGVQFGEEVPRHMKGKGTLHVVPVDAFIQSEFE